MEIRVFRLNLVKFEAIQMSEMPPQQPNASSAPANRTIPYDLRHTHIPHVSPPPPQGQKCVDAYTPAVAAKEVARIKNEAKKRGHPISKRQAPAPLPAIAAGPSRQHRSHSHSSSHQPSLPALPRHPVSWKIPAQLPPAKWVRFEEAQETVMPSEASYDESELSEDESRGEDEAQSALNEHSDSLNPSSDPADADEEEEQVAQHLFLTVMG